MAINGLFHHFNTSFFAKMVRTQQTEVIVWVDVVECKYEVYECLPAATTSSQVNANC